MDTYDLETAFYSRLVELTYNNLETARPDEIIDPATVTKSVSWRRGQVMLGEGDPIAFGYGVYTRYEGIYQIDLYVPRTNYNALGDQAGALKQLKNMSDTHLAHFWPSNGRGLTVTQNDTSAHITHRPSQRYLGREGVFLREVISVDFYVDVLASA